MIILAIETSCDETAIAVVECKGGFVEPKFSSRRTEGGKILSNIVSSQIKIHAPFGGVVPSLAKREHQRNLTHILAQALQKARLLKSKIKNQKSKIQIKIKKETEIEIDKILEREIELLKLFKKHIFSLKAPKVDAIAVTAGPGLEPALWVGVNFARALSFLWGKPLIAVNHVEAHIVANWLKPAEIAFPLMCLIVSGGHTQLVLVKNFGKYKIIGETRDDAAGEAFDKVAKMLKLGFPGGPAIAAEAAKILNPKSQILNKFKIQNSPPKADPPQAEKFKITLPRPMINSKDYDFSFSGLKTAVLYLIKNLQNKGYSLKKITPALCAEFQQAAVDVLVSKTIKAAKQYKVKSVLLGGGVSANRELRGQMEKAVKEKLAGVSYHQPALEFTGDNAAMIAAVGCLKFKNAPKKKITVLKNKWKTLKAKADWRI